MDDFAAKLEEVLPCDGLEDCRDGQHTNDDYNSCPAAYRPAVEKLIREILAGDFECAHLAGVTTSYALGVGERNLKLCRRCLDDLKRNMEHF